MDLPINIVICANDDYSDYAAALVTSILENAKSRNSVYIHLFNRQSDSVLIKRLQKIVSRYGARIEEYHLLEAAYRQLPAKDYKSLDAYSRLFAPRMVQGDPARLIYLDIDTIVRTDLQDLVTLDLKGNTIAAVRDKEYEDGEGKSPLFNSGVMVIDVKRWKERKIEEQVLLEIRHSQGGIVPLADQDDLNEILHSDWLELPLNWNAMCGNIYKQEIDVRVAKIIHFNGGTIHKPDHVLCINPGKVEYFKYLNLTRNRALPYVYMPVMISRLLLFLSHLLMLQ
jgi:lipopolysaccharide biosynthesis glycosyltransferase